MPCILRLRPQTRKGLLSALTHGCVRALCLLSGLYFGVFVLYPAHRLLAQVDFTSSNLPIVIIDTLGRPILDTPRITAAMRIIAHGNGRRNAVADTVFQYSGKISIEIRGATSQSFPKKQYAFESQDALGQKLNVSLLGLPKENDWILQAPYSDKSLMRNVLAYGLARNLGGYASRTRFCEVVLNNRYQGVYVLMEKIKRDKHRVDIAKLKPDEVTGDALTGGYIIKLDKTVGEQTAGWRSDYPLNVDSAYQLYFQYHYPKANVIVPAQADYIQQFMDRLESTFWEDDYRDAEWGYRRYIDVDSFIDYFILTEIGKNVDGYRLSTYFYKDKDSKGGLLHCGPLWDCNLAFGNADFYNGHSVRGWQKDQVTGERHGGIPFWWRRLYADEAFTDQLEQRWLALRQGALSNASVNHMIDSLALSLEEAQARNFMRWPVLGQYVWPNAFVGDTFAEEIDYLKNWIERRLIWMDGNLPFGPEASPESAGDALHFDGVDDFVDCGNASALQISGKQITLEAWINMAEWRLRSYQGYIIGKDQMGPNQDRGYVLRCGDQGQVDLVLGDGHWHELYSPRGLMRENEWNHLAATYDGQVMRIYINGTLVASQLDVFTIGNAAFRNLYIGASPSDVTRSPYGCLDEIRVWNVARSGHAIRKTMNVPLGSPYCASADSGLVGYWRLSERQGQSVQDLSVYQNHGILGSTPGVDSHDPQWAIATHPVTGVKSHPRQFELAQNYPNPFNPVTRIDFFLPHPRFVDLAIYNIQGRKVRQLILGQCGSGTNSMLWEGRNDSGCPVAAGLYFYRLKTGAFSQTRKMLLVK